MEKEQVICKSELVSTIRSDSCSTCEMMHLANDPQPYKVS